MPKQQTRRERLRESTLTEIKETAHKQMAENGAAALSLNAIAREMGMSTPALYRYFKNRDALVTELIIEAYQALGDRLEAADKAIESEKYHVRFHAVCQAYRNWAVAYPQAYTLIYGTPIPHYHAPRERTVPLAGRIMTIFGTILGEAWQADEITMPASYTQISAHNQQIIDSLLQDMPAKEATAPIFILTILVWSRINGVVWSELYGHFVPGMAETGELFQTMITAICAELNLKEQSK